MAVVGKEDGGVVEEELGGAGPDAVGATDGVGGGYGVEGGDGPDIEASVVRRAVVGGRGSDFNCGAGEVFAGNTGLDEVLGHAAGGPNNLIHEAIAVDSSRIHDDRATSNEGDVCELECIKAQVGSVKANFESGGLRPKVFTNFVEWNHVLE